MAEFISPVQAGAHIRLDDIDPGSTPRAPGDHSATKPVLRSLNEELRKLQDRLWAENKRSLLVVLQAMDAGGKDGTIKHVFKGVLPQATSVSSFKQPTPLELRHDFLWRVHRAAPPAGEVGIFNRSHYEDVLTVRVHETVPEDVWRQRYDLINSFEKTLANGGTTILKLYLHISKEEQRRRLERRLNLPDKRWKFQRSDIEERQFWDKYQVAYEEVFHKTSTSHAPWYVIPSNHKWYRNWAVSQLIVETLRDLDPRYPDPPDLSGIKVV